MIIISNQELRFFWGASDSKRLFQDVGTFPSLFVIIPALLSTDNDQYVARELFIRIANKILECVSNSRTPLKLFSPNSKPIEAFFGEIANALALVRPIMKNLEGDDRERIQALFDVGAHLVRVSPCIRTIDSTIDPGQILIRPANSVCIYLMNRQEVNTVRQNLINQLPSGTEYGYLTYTMPTVLFYEKTNMKESRFIDYIKIADEKTKSIDDNTKLSTKPASTNEDNAIYCIKIAPNAIFPSFEKICDTKVTEFEIDQSDVDLLLAYICLLHISKG